MLKIWGRTNSINVQKVMWCVAELGLEHERIDAGMAFGKNREDWYLHMNPNGLVPTIDDDGFQLWESNSIVRYLAARCGRLYPSDLKQRAVAEAWMDWQLTVLHPPMTAILWNLVRKPPAERDAALIADSVRQAADVLARLDSHLADREFIAGAEFTVGDIPVGAMTYRWHAFPDIDRPELPNLQAWYQRLQERPAFREHVMLPLS